MIEVTSSTSMADCRMAMEQLLMSMLIDGFGVENSSEENIANVLHLKQIKIVDEEGNLRRVYPSKTDLEFGDNEHILIDRE